MDPAAEAAGVPMEGDTMGFVVAALLGVAWWAARAARRPQGGRW